MPDPALPLPDPPLGVFDARPYQEYQPGVAQFIDPAMAKDLPREPRGVLVVGLTASGDVLHFLPLAVALRRAFPRARLGWVVQDKARVIVEGRSDLDHVHVFERQRWARGLISPVHLGSTLREILSFRRELRAGGYELLVDPQGTAKSALVNLASGIGFRIGFAPGFCREFNDRTTTAHVRLPTRRMHRVRKSLALLQAAGIDINGHGARYQVPPEAQAAADRELQQLGVAGRRFMVIHPGTSRFGARKRWPATRFGQVADRAHAVLGLTPVFVLGPLERNLKDELFRGIGTAPRVVVEPDSLAHLAGILARAACVVGCDSAPLHLASNLRTPVVGLYGPTDPVLFAPYYSPAVVVVKGLTCQHCGAPHCNHSVPRMEAITVDEVLEGVHLVLQLTPT